jgi:hypothetical protein
MPSLPRQVDREKQRKRVERRKVTKEQNKTVKIK